jgi:hypothetical protein
LGSIVDPGKWFHLLIAADFESSSSYASLLNNKLYVTVNGAVRGLYGPDGSHEMTNGDMYPAARCEDGSGVAGIVNSYIGGRAVLMEFCHGLGGGYHPGIRI